jgi:hypothetical protein
MLTLLVGPTGVGKTSLVQAGVAPALLESDCLPVIVRMDWFSLPLPPKPEIEGDAVETGPTRSENPLTRQLIAALETATAERGVAGPKLREGESLWEYFHRAKHRWWSGRQRVITPVIIIDRFEEAFTIGRSNATAKRHADRFFDELSELANNRPPARLAKRIETGEEPGDAFVFDNVPVRVLLVMREEFAARLTDLRTAFPMLRRSQFRLAPFSTSQARDAIQRAAAQRNLFADGGVDAVVEFLASEGPGEQTILPAHHSVVCSALSIERAHRGAAPISRDFLAVRPGRLMHDFITAAVSDLPPAARALLEEHLTDIRGTAQRIPLTEALSRTGLPREALDTLVQRHLVRIDSHSSVPYVSLAHDLLASVLAITRLERVAQAREQSAVLQQAQVQAQMQAQAATVEHKVKQQRILTWTVGAGAAVIAAGALAAAITMAKNRGETVAVQRATPAPQTLPTPLPPAATTPAPPPPPSTPTHASTTQQPAAKGTEANGATVPAVKSPTGAAGTTSPPADAGVGEGKGDKPEPPQTSTLEEESAVRRNPFSPNPRLNRPEFTPQGPSSPSQEDGAERPAPSSPGRESASRDSEGTNSPRREVDQPRVRRPEPRERDRERERPAPPPILEDPPKKSPPSTSGGGFQPNRPQPPRAKPVPTAVPFNRPTYSVNPGR